MIWLLWAAVLVLAGFGLGAWRGAPYLPTLKADRERLVDMAELKPGQTLLDLGSGDGALLLAAARRGLRANGLEINPILVLVSRWRCRRYRQLVRVYWGDFWRAPWPPADAIVVFLIRRRMAQLDRRLAEIGPPVKLISYVFEIPGRPAVKSAKNIFVYRYPN